MQRTGKTCEQQGFYRSNDCGYEVEILEGQEFPECPVHDRPATWTLIKATVRARKRRAKSNSAN